MRITIFGLLLILVCGCKQEQKIGEWDKTAEMTGVETTQNTPKPLVELTGRDFINDDFTTDSLVAPTVLSLKRFGGVSASLELEQPTELVRVVLKTRGIDEVFPIVGMTVATEAGKYQEFKIMDQEAVDNTKQIEKQLNLPPGKYLISIAYHTATDPSKRPPLDIHTVTFE